MNLEKLISGASRLFFLGAFLLLALAVCEKIANVGGYTIMHVYRGGQLLDFAGVLLLFVIATKMREVSKELKSGKP